MSGEKEDGLGLSLSLGIMSCPQQNKLKNYITLSSSTPPPPPPLALNLLPFMHHHQSSSGRNDEERGRVRGEIDMNEPARMIVECDNEQDDDDEEENQVIMVSSPNSTVSSVSGKRSHDEGERTTSSLEDDGGDAAARKKLRLSKEQAAVLEETFKEHNTLNPKQKLALATQLNLRPRQVEVWFQNRRARTKLKQTEVDCEYLKRCCENLTAENRRLQKEVVELRALKLSPQLYMNMSPPTTLTMCPQCERVAVSSSSSSAASSSVNRPSASRSHHHPEGALHQAPVPLNKPWAAILAPKTLGVQQRSQV
ncbi:Homeobox-leucine zipper protein ATHB-4 [Capsicum annuum]|uniref:Homeobox-leucine zipper protein ATHB-4 n=1 Tax=Capsicum annuum TaxID=4072 RepID=A0A1U8EEI8_CAPAN|nr:homeobox-leucine zipper protein HAT3 [Capsicum annuum]KAF3632764.1 Homeobox-leucine zipper protein ATHB-4 [Capsicum annuum]KAF3657900.1 Homeobox-leucine zipper protein ATHB-4 [Capsicum annuum]PHT93681.1 Homeobox-leucine zipper protein ATHB-4 [Capsicum annuum]